ncbi:MAG: hypothetical protein K6B41_08790 [Butyrivibrio sp.]|nr:hypothetical protein [Butyrivibrio sp.]
MAYLNEVEGIEIQKIMKFLPESIIDEYKDTPGYEFYQIEDKGENIGVIACMPDNENIWIRYVYIVPYMRGQGIMNRSLDQLSVMFWGDGYQRMMIRYVPFMNPEFKSYCESSDYINVHNGSAFFEFNLIDVVRAQALKGEPRNVIMLGDLSLTKRNELYEKIKNSGIALIDFDNIEKRYLINYSLVYVENNKPSGLVLLEKNASDGLGIALFYLASGKATAAYYMIIGLKKVLENYFSLETKLSFFCRNPYLTRLLEKMLETKGYREVISELDLNTLDKY